MTYEIDNWNDHSVYALRYEGQSCGKILLRWTRSRTCHALVYLYSAMLPEVLYTRWLERNANPATNTTPCGIPVTEGKAGGYGYDKASAAVASALRKIGLAGDHDLLAPWVFINTEADRAAQPAAGEAIKAAGVIPVYSGAGNIREAFALWGIVAEKLV